MRVNDVDLEVEVSGQGEPILLIHGAFIADALRPIADRLSDHQTILYHRRGYAGSSGDPADVPTHTADAIALLDVLEIPKAHVLGHSYGGSVGIQLTANAPDRVASLSLLEPGLVAQIPNAALIGEGMGPIVQQFMDGNAEVATNMFFDVVLGTDRPWLEANVPGALTQSIGDALDGFGGDFMSLGNWTFGKDDAAPITCPVLFVLGSISGEVVRSALANLGTDIGDVDMFGEMIDLARTWLPQTELATVPGLSHALQIQDPEPVAKAVSAFLAAHKIAVTA